MRRDSTTADTGADKGNRRRPEWAGRIVRVAVIVLVAAFVLFVQAAVAADESETQREGDWEVRVRAAVRAPVLFGEAAATGDFVVVVFTATHVDDGQGRFDKASFELRELGGGRIAKHDERLSERAAKELGLPLLGSPVNEGSTAEFVVVFADVTSASSGMAFRLDSNRFLFGSISFDLSRFLSESLTARLVALPRPETTIPPPATPTPTHESPPTSTPEPPPTPTPVSTPTPEPTSTPIPRRWTCPVGTRYDEATRACVLAPAERVRSRGPSQARNSPTGEYTVQAGDTLRSIAKRFGTTIESLIEANDIDDPNVIRTGSILLVPASTTVAEDIVDDSESSLTAFPPARHSTSTPRTTPSPAPTPTPNPTPTPKATPTPTPRLPIRATLRDWGYEILQLIWDPEIKDGSRVVEPHGRFLLVVFRLENRRSNESSVNAWDFTVEDSIGRTFDVVTFEVLTSDSIFNPSYAAADGLGLAHYDAEVQPGSAITTGLLFDVPTNANDLQIELFGGLFQATRHVSIGDAPSIQNAIPISTPSPDPNKGSLSDLQHLRNLYDKAVNDALVCVAEVRDAAAQLESGNLANYYRQYEEAKGAEIDSITSAADFRIAIGNHGGILSAQQANDIDRSFIGFVQACGIYVLQLTTNNELLKAQDRGDQNAVDRHLGQMEALLAEIVEIRDELDVLAPAAKDAFDSAEDLLRDNSP